MLNQMFNESSVAYQNHSENRKELLLNTLRTVFVLDFKLFQAKPIKNRLFPVAWQSRIFSLL